MVHLFLTQALAVDLLAHVRTVPGLEGVVQELEAELGPAAMLLPCDALPVLSIWYRGSAVDYYHADRADEIWRGVHETIGRRAASDACALPLFAGLEGVE